VARRDISIKANDLPIVVDDTALRVHATAALLSDLTCTVGYGWGKCCLVLMVWMDAAKEIIIVAYSRRIIEMKSHDNVLNVLT